MKITKEICKTLFNHDFLKLNSEDKEKLDQLAAETLSDNSWEDVYSCFDQYLRNECNTEDDVINYVFLFIRYVGLNFNIPSQYDPYDLIGFILSKVDLEKRWDDCDSFDDFANEALRIDLYRYQFWRDPKVIEAAKKKRRHKTMNYIELSKEISYALRHAPWEYELELDEEWFVPIVQLLDALNESGNYERLIVKEDLEHIIATSDKRRHEIVGDKIRALYGHSVPNKIQKEKSVPPDVLYHGTTHKFMDSIMKNGLVPKERQYVHLSMDKETALIVGKRRDENPVLLEIDAKCAYLDGINFYIGNDKVWLSDSVPPKYIKIKER